MTEPGKYQRLKISIDILSVIFVVYAFVIFPFWLYCDPNASAHISPGKKWPIEIIVFFADAFPCAFGCIWLILRHPLHKKYPFVLTWRYRLLMMVIALVMGTFFNLILKDK